MKKTELDAIMFCFRLLHRENQALAKCISVDLSEENQKILKDYFDCMDEFMIKAIKKVGLEIEE